MPLAYFLVMTLVVVLAAFFLFSKGESSTDEVVQWPPPPVSTVPAKPLFDATTLSSEEQQALLINCRRAVADLASEEFLRSAQIVDSTWDGSIGAVAAMASAHGIKPISDRIALSETHGFLNSTFVAFGLVDSFSGVKRKLISGDCRFTSPNSADVSIGWLSVDGATIGSGDYSYIRSQMVEFEKAETGG
ncbi:MULTISPECIES: hypothetical protein [unclassified Aliiroseovarius]|uniref:hypothetical protein n=1 Tax=unclassified Aliiroseovarius TaxID=2623558 RepID=UPI00158DAFCD|nr:MULTISPECIES: hypothetical protein [unclassified Aliiroseovarius]